MLRNYLFTAWRNIIKNGLFSFINISGLAIGLASCILILLFVRAETGFDSWLNGSERLLRLHTAYTLPGQPPFLTVRSAGKMKDALEQYAKNEVEAGSHLIPYEMTVRKGADAFSQEISFVDEKFFTLFELPFVHGNRERALDKPYNLVISETQALKYFGKTDVLGETLTVCCFNDELVTLSISGVMRDMPQNTHLNLQMIVRFPPSVFQDFSGVLDTWNSVNVYTYFKMREGVRMEDLQERIYYWANNESPFSAMLQERMGLTPEETRVTDSVKHRVMRVPDLHLRAREYAGTMGDLSPMGDYKMINTFIAVAALILLIACINFMNLATARAGQRAREVAVRKVLGASRGQVAMQFLSEAFALVFISLLFALVLVELVLPLYNLAIGMQIKFQPFADPLILFSLLGLTVLVGLGAGLYPALYLSRFLPGHILKGSKGAETNGGSRLRTALVVFQFTASIFLLVSTAVIYSQTQYANSIDVGYEYKDKLVLDLGGANNSLESLRLELLSLPEIDSVVYSSESPSQDNENNSFFKLLEVQEGNQADQNQLLNLHNMGYGFFEAYKVRPLAGRLFDEKYGSDMIVPPEEGQQEPGNASVILNESALKKYGFSDPEQAIGKTLEADIYIAGIQRMQIIGVIPDIYFRSIKFSVRPSVYMLNPERFRVANLTYNTGDLPALLSRVEAVWKKHVPLTPITLSALNEMMSAQYESERIEARLFSAFALLAIVIACLGLYGLAAFTAQRRTMEIGVRKIMGARVRDIVVLLIWQFSKPVMWANLLAWPLSFYLMLKWLESFPYRIDSLWILPICLLAGGVSLLIAWLTVGGNAAKVANANPIAALRHE